MPEIDITEARQASTTPDTTDPLRALSEQIQIMSVAVERILRQRPDGLSELMLIKTLQRPPWELIGPVNYAEPEQLYPVHFLLFHVLYRLRDQLGAEGLRLDISALGIRLSENPVIGGSGPAAPVDQLRAFYLDLSNAQLPEETIAQMMDDFWAGRSGQRLAESDVREAAQVLGLNGIPDAFAEVKQTFRRAVMRAHPDRGGETETIQELNQAFGILKAHFSERLKHRP